MLDGLLDGGFEKDAITTIYGPAGSGKTNLALLACISVAKKKKVVYLDTEGGFSPERLAQLVPDAKKVMDNILFFRPTSFEKQGKAFDQVANLMAGKQGRSVGLIVVDTIGSLFRLERDESTSRDFASELGSQVRCLNEISRKLKIPVLVLNQVYTGMSGDLRMVGHDLMSFSSKCLIELSPGKYGQRTAVLKKHRSLPEDRQARFAIVQEGIVGV